MWVIMENGNAINNKTGDELYIDYGKDGLYRVRRNHQILDTEKTGVDAKEFIKKYVEKENEKNEGV